MNSPAPQTKPLFQDAWLSSLTQAPALVLDTPVVPAPVVRLIRLEEINEERHQAYRQALANVYAALDPHQPAHFLYLLDGGSRAKGVALYFGVIAAQDDDAHEAMKNLYGALEGQLPGIHFGEKVSPEGRQTLFENWKTCDWKGVMLGVPTAQAEDDGSDEQNFQGIDRLVRALQSSFGEDAAKASPSGARWQLAVISQPLTREQIRQQLDAAYALSSQLALRVRTSVQASDNTSRQKSASSGTSEATGSSSSRSDTRGKNTGGTEGTSWGKSSTSGGSSNSSGENSGGSQSKTYGTSSSVSDSTGNTHTATRSENLSLSDTQGSTFGLTHEISDKRAQHLVEYLDKQLIARLQKGLTKGLFSSAVYLAAEHRSIYQRLKNTLRATCQGSEATMNPLEVYDLPHRTPSPFGLLPTLAQALPGELLLFRSLHTDARKTLGSLITADELAIVASLPQHELQGIRRRKTVDFIVDLPDVPTQAHLDLGEVIDRGRRHPDNRVRLARADLNKHIFVTGVTGAGKTTTCLNLLLESRLPFLVIEPAKTEYRALSKQAGFAIDYYRPNGDAHQSLRINPFALVSKSQRIKSHVGFLKNVFAAVFPMEASMPMMVEAAILTAYEDKGWDIDENEFLPGGDPFDPATRAWPTMSDMIQQLDRLIPTYKLGKEFEEKYRGSLVSRLRSLTDGTLGQVLDVPQSIDYHALLERHVVIELEELQGGEEKAVLMALLLGGINEAVRARHAREPDFRQLTLIEEAHRLLSRPEPGDRTAAMAVEAFADMLAEVRKYGTGLIIADQIPAKLIPDVIKNTHGKIVHRLFAEDDRRTMGEAMMMNDEQRNFLPNLDVGEAVVFCGGWHGAAHAAIRNDRAGTDAPLPPLDLVACGIRQLWRERSRYYPQFCRLGWMSEAGDEPQRLAEFVRETRQAHNQLLCLLGEHPQHAARSASAFTRLRAWHARWQPQALEHQPLYSHWCAQSAEKQPPDLLAAAWLALLLDANPRPHAHEKEVPPLQPKTEADRDNLLAASTALVGHIAGCQTLTDFLRALQAANDRDLVHHRQHLAHFKNF